MKLKNLFTTLGLAAVLGIGVGVGLTAKENSKEAKAAQTSWYVVGTFSGVNKWSAGTGYAMTNTHDNVWVKEKLSFAAGDEFKICDETTGSWQGGWAFNNGESSSAIRECFTAANNDANIVCHTAGLYDVEFDKSTWHITIAESQVASYTVGFDEDGDGTADKTFDVAEGETVAFYTPFQFGKTFVTWNLGENAFDFDTPITEDILLTGVWTDREDEASYIYVITGYGADWSTRYIYGYGDSEGYGSWKGTLLTDVAVGCTQTTNFGGGSDQYLNGGIYKVPFYAVDGMTNIILHNNGSDDDRSGDLPLGEGYGYAFKNNPWNEEGDCFDEEKLFSLGRAAEYVYNFDEIVSGQDFCALDPEVCANLWNDYKNLARDDEYINGWITSSCINVANEGGQDNVSLGLILPELRKIAERDGQYVEESMAKNALEVDSNATMVIVVVAAFIAISTFGVCLIIKRRKQLNK